MCCQTFVFAAQVFQLIKHIFAPELLVLEQLLHAQLTFVLCGFLLVCKTTFLRKQKLIVAFALTDGCCMTSCDCRFLTTVGLTVVDAQIN